MGAVNISYPAADLVVIFYGRSCFVLLVKSPKCMGTRKRDAAYYSSWLGACQAASDWAGGISITAADAKRPESGGSPEAG